MLIPTTRKQICEQYDGWSLRLLQKINIFKSIVLWTPSQSSSGASTGLKFEKNLAPNAVKCPKHQRRKWFAASFFATKMICCQLLFCGIFLLPKIKPVFQNILFISFLICRRKHHLLQVLSYLAANHWSWITLWSVLLLYCNAGTMVYTDNLRREAEQERAMMAAID